MNRIIQSFTEDPALETLKETKTYYIFKNIKNNFEIKVDIITDDKVTVEFKDHFE